MPIGLILLALAAAADPQPVDEIVVTARPHSDKCEVRLADRVLTKQQFSDYARIWAAGKPVRVITPRGATQRCIDRIGLDLASRGVRLMEFVKPSEAAPVN